MFGFRFGCSNWRTYAVELGLERGDFAGGVLRLTANEEEAIFGEGADFLRVWNGGDLVQFRFNEVQLLDAGGAGGGEEDERLRHGREHGAEFGDEFFEIVADVMMVFVERVEGVGDERMNVFGGAAFVESEKDAADAVFEFLALFGIAVDGGGR